jgi:hypothetical protein
MHQPSLCFIGLPRLCTWKSPSLPHFRLTQDGSRLTLVFVPLNPLELEVLLTSNIGNHAAHSFNIEKAAITLEESVAGIVKVIDVASRDSHGGKLWEYNGGEVPW